jgi:hypothetical protein
MSTAKGTQQDVPGKHTTSIRKKTLHKGEGSGSHELAAPHPECGVKLFALTVDATTAQIVKFESLDASGARSELSDDEKMSLVRTGNGDRLEELVEQAFEAGIACVLGDEGESRTKESKEDAELRHLLLTPLIEGSLAKRLLTGEVLNRAVLGTLLQHSMKFSADTAAGGSAGSVQ